MKEKTTLNRKVEVSDTEESESDQSQVEEKDVPKSSTSRPRQSATVEKERRILYITSLIDLI